MLVRVSHALQGGVRALMTDLRTFENSETDSRASAPAARGGEDNALDAPTREPLASAQACQRANHNDTATTRVDLALDEGAAEVLKVGELRLGWASAPGSTTRACLKHAITCTCDFSAIDQTITCANMLARERAENDEMWGRVTREDYNSRLRAVQHVRYRLVEGIVRSGIMNDFSVVTASLAVRYMDYFLTTSGYQIGNDSFWLYQLLSAACLFIACKFEEPANNLRNSVGTRLQLSNDISFDLASLKKMEAIVLRELKWRVSRVTPLCFVPIFFRLVDCNGLVWPQRDGFDIDMRIAILREAELLTTTVLYDASALCYFESSVIAKAILCILLAKFCDDIGSDEIVPTVTMNILKKVYADGDADYFSYVIRRVTECVRIIEGMKATLKQYAESMEHL